MSCGLFACSYLLTLPFFYFIFYFLPSLSCAIVTSALFIVTCCVCCVVNIMLRALWFVLVVLAQFSAWPSVSAYIDHLHCEEIAIREYDGSLQGRRFFLHRRHASNFFCHTLGRFLLQAAPTPDSVTYLPYPPPPPSDPTPPPIVNTPIVLPTLPTDPEASTTNSSSPSSARTDPSTLLTPPYSSRTPDDRTSFSKVGGSNMAGKVGISAGVGVTGIVLVILGLLYYFKPDIFMCCKTCVRVQIFHHNSSKK
uniref:Uncharacterized protein n=1 Tax=Physcomitrium patens TaxID=3218 RepID=A0A2K1KQM6_PHYPA|nr:hypothetical protein PHYPA_006972 [Physcomitrium patens]